MLRTPHRILALAALSAAFALAQQIPPAVVADPAPDAAHPASMRQLEIPLNGAMTFGFIYEAAGAGAHPTALLLHGFPGYEQNLDLAQAMRRAGWNVVTFHYRGSWGSHGSFSFHNAMDDTVAMLDHLRAPATARALGIDPARIVVVGHSMGGFLAAYAAAQRPWVAGLVMISAWNIGGEAATVTPKNEARMLADYRENTGPLAGCTAASLLAEARAHARAYNFLGFAAALKMPVLLLDANDGSRPGALAMAQALRRARPRPGRGNALPDRSSILGAAHRAGGGRPALAPPQGLKRARKPINCCGPSWRADSNSPLAELTRTRPEASSTATMGTPLAIESPYCFTTSRL